MQSPRHAVTSTLALLACAVIGAVIPVRASPTTDPHRPAPFDVVYQVKTGGVAVGKMSRRFEIDALDSYRFTSIIEAEGLVALLKPTRIEESSTGIWRDGRAVAERYAYEKKSGKKRKETVIAFDWAQGQAQASINGTHVNSAVTAGTLDKLNYQLAVMRDLAAGTQTLAYRVADVGESKDYALEQRPTEQVKVGGKTYDTVPVTYSRTDGRRTVLWCAAVLGYLPVKIEYTEKDGAVTRALLVPAKP